jgi:hypothetical protein
MYQVYYGSSAVFRARRPIVKGEQLTCCYMEPALPAAFFRTSRRQKALMELHKFQCRYEAKIHDLRQQNFNY